MKVIIIYMTRHGCAEKAAKMLKDRLGEGAETVNLKKSGPIQLENYDTVIIGGSIHVGQMQRKVKKFCEKNREILGRKNLGLYLCCMEEGEKAREQFDAAFDTDLRSHATAQGLFGGEFDFSRMNFLEKKVIKKVADITESVSKIDESKIVRFVESITGRAE
ncbi:MAG: flavodoxin domain-containing protein [Candidatus Krumholzibacteria bacterium]|nr:flavodoxin domain-containing protein [Candidatus Krumholzibacteria bacterium]